MKKKNNKILVFIYIFLIPIILFSAYKIISILTEYTVSSYEYMNLNNNIIDKNKKTKNNNTPISVNFNKLKNVNEDIIGWIYVQKEPSINYPILKSSTKDYFYLRHTYKKTKNIAGSIFTDYRNNNFFNEDNTIIYGHNMKNKTMFSNLKNLTYNPGETANEPYIWILTENKILKYRIFSIYTAHFSSNTYKLNFNDKNYNVKYKQNCINKNNYKELSYPIDINKPIITLSTCTDKEGIRLIVHASLVEDI